MARWVFFDLSQTLASSPKQASKLPFFSAVLGKLAECPFTAGLSPEDLERMTLEVKHCEDPDRFSMEHRIYISLYKHGVELNLDVYEEGQRLKSKLNEVLQEQELYDSTGYKLWPDTKDSLNTLRGLGFHIGLLVNSSRPGKITKILKDLELESVFDLVATSALMKQSLPSATVVIGLAQQVNAAEVWLVGDMLDRHVLAAQQSGHKAVWLNLDPKSPVRPNQLRNAEAIDSGAVRYPAAVVSMNQLPSLLTHFDVPDRIRVGYIYDKPHKKRNLTKVTPT